MIALHKVIRSIITTNSAHFQNVFLHTRDNEDPALSRSFGLKSVFEKLRFYDGLVWMVGLTVEKAALPGKIIFERTSRFVFLAQLFAQPNLSPPRLFNISPYNLFSIALSLYSLA